YAYEAMEAASVADDVADDTEVCVEIAKRKFCFSNNQQLTLNWSVRAARETADFARAVTKYKEASYRKQVTGNREEENHTAVATTRPMIEPEWKIRVEAVFAKAKIDKSENSWRAAGVEAKKASTICQNAQGMSHRETMEATRQTEYWTEKANISEVKSLATTQCADDWDAQVERANAIMRMIREKFGSPISNAMREFIVHPSEATLRATGKSFVIAMTAAEAEDALESAEVFAKISTDAVALAKREDWDASAQENINFSASVTSEIAEFARAVAAFKKLQEANASSERSFKF
ncbi:MAG TPA: hypothetical protein VJK54_11725, partial [Chthoniobacterales bacterium]|nr:hypothetical protein [Chthoniobacterales bacterium]